MQANREDYHIAAVIISVPIIYFPSERRYFLFQLIDSSIAEVTFSPTDEQRPMLESWWRIDEGWKDMNNNFSVGLVHHDCVH